LKAGSEISYKEGSIESQIFGPRCFRDLLAMTVEAICQMYPPRVNLAFTSATTSNYSYVIQDEVQSFHWNNSQCSLHPAVIYFLDSSGKLGTKSFCVVSEDLLHDVPFVHEVQQVLMNWIKANLQGIDSVIYFSDGWAKQ